jgi:hypothetical protein
MLRVVKACLPLEAWGLNHVNRVIEARVSSCSKNMQRSLTNSLEFVFFTFGVEPVASQRGTTKLQQRGSRLDIQAAKL